MSTGKTTVSSDEQAWDLLERWLLNEPIDKVDFREWPILRISIKGGDYDSSLNSSQMAALIEFKRTIARTYSAVVHGAYDMRRLTVEEEAKLDFSTHVEEGSSITETDLTPLVQALASAVNANPTATVIMAAVIGLLLVARPLILKHYEVKAKRIDAEERKGLLNLSLSDHEESRYRLFEKSIKKLSEIYPQISKALPDAALGFWRFASASANADNMNVAGIDFSRDDLEILSERRDSRPANIVEIEQLFEVKGVYKAPTSYRVQLFSPNLILSAIYRRPELSERRVRVLMRCMSDSIPIDARVEVKTIDKAQVVGRLIFQAQV